MYLHDTFDNLFKCNTFNRALDLACNEAKNNVNFRLQLLYPNLFEVRPVAKEKGLLGYELFIIDNKK